MTNRTAFFETGQSLDTLKSVIMLEWEKLVREVIISSKGEPSIILEDHIPVLLDQLSGILRTGDVDELEIGKSHGYFTSTMTKFSVADILTEYSLLREILITYLYPIGEPGCAKVIHKFLDILMKHAVVEYMNNESVHRSLPQEKMDNEISEIKNNPIIHSLS